MNLPAQSSPPDSRGTLRGCQRGPTLRASRFGALLLALTLLTAGVDGEARVDQPVSVLLDMLRYDASSPTAVIVVKRLGGMGQPGWKALAALATDPVDAVTQLQAVTELCQGTAPARLDLAAEVYEKVARADVRERVARFLARTYPRHAAVLHTHVREGRGGALDVLRLVANRGLPRSEIEALPASGPLSELARELLRGRAAAPETLALLPRARALAPDGLDPQRARAFAHGLALAPDRVLLRALAEVLREDDDTRKAGAHCLLLVASGMALPADAALWLSWIAAQGGAYVPPDRVSKGAVAAAVIRAARHIRADLESDGYSRHAYKHASSTTNGCTALSVLALHAAGVPSSDAVIQKALETRLLVRDAEGNPGLRAYPARYETYGLALMAMAFQALGAQGLEAPLTAVRDKLTAGIVANGQWTYTCATATQGGAKTGDNSNTQYANLGLRALRGAGQPVPAPIWERVDKHWRATQQGTGEWGYRVSGRDARRSRLAMTASGIAGLALAAEALHGAGAAKRVASDAAIQKGLAALGRALMLSDIDRIGPYQLYAVERACVLTGTQQFAGGGKRVDWYREGAWRFLQTQHADGSWGVNRIKSWERDGFGKAPDTAFAILFLTKATATLAGEHAQSTVPVSVTAAEVETPPPSRAPSSALRAGIPWIQGIPTDEQAITLEVATRHLRTRTGRTTLAGRVTGPVSRLTVAGLDVEPEEGGRFVAVFDVSGPGTIEAVAHGLDGRTVRVDVVVEIDETKPVLTLVGGPRRAAAKQRLVFEANEPLDGVRAGRYFFPAEGNRVTITVEFRPGPRKLVLTAIDMANNKGRHFFDFEIENRVLEVDGKSALRVALKAKPAVFTAECWVNPADGGGRAAVFGDTERAGMGLFLDPESFPVAYLRQEKDYVRLRANRTVKPGRWTHVAITYDGAHVRLWVDGRLGGEAPAASYKRSAYPIYVGAEPKSRGRTESYFNGAIDEFRLSDNIRYKRTFRPEDSHGPDRNALLLLHFDTDAGGVFRDASNERLAVAVVGAPQAVAAKR